MAKKRKNSRRANGEGSIVQRKDGRWCGVVTLGYKPDGKINRKSVYGHSQAEVLEKMSVLKHRLVTGPQVSSTTALVGETMKNWLRIFKKPMVSSRAFESNIRTFKNHILPAIGNMKINEVNTNIVQAILTKSLQDHKGRSNTPKRIKFLLNQFYEHLIEQGLAYDNPTLKCKVSNRYKKTYIDSKGQHKNNENYKAIPVAERARFIRALDDGPDIIKPLSLVMMLASLRIGEALALKWENIDFEKGALFVEQGLTEDVEFDNDLNIVGRKNIISSTKTSCSKRAIKMPQLVIDALLQWRKIQWCKEQVKGKILTKSTNLVFCNDDGTIRSYDATRRVFDRFAKKHGFRQEFGLHCHMLRQTFSNMQIENKRNIKDVQHLLGHKDAKTTQLHYNSVIDQELDYEGAELLDSLFNDTTLYDGEEHIKKDVPAYHIENNTFNTETIEQKPKTYEEMTDDELDRQYEELKRQREERKKRRKEKDFEM